jgi:hypothetical protein
LEASRLDLLRIRKKPLEGFQHIVDVLFGQRSAVLHPQLDLIDTDGARGARDEVGVFEPFDTIVQSDEMICHFRISFSGLLPGENVEIDAGGDLGFVVS